MIILIVSQETSSLRLKTQQGHMLFLFLLNTLTEITDCETQKWKDRLEKKEEKFYFYIQHECL